VFDVAFTAKLPGAASEPLLESVTGTQLDAPLPAELTATISNEYVAPAVKPLTVAEVELAPYVPANTGELEPVS
jgi:hypothetical protein